MKPISQLALCAIAPFAALRASAQTLAPGTWGGTLRVGGGLPMAIEYVVQTAGDTLAVTMKTRSGPAVAVTELSVGEGALTFRWGAFSCRLHQQGRAGYEGTCTAEDGTAGQLTLSAPKDPRPPRRGRDVLTAEDLAGTGASNLYDAIQRLHAEWLRPRSPNSSIMFPTVVRVYLDGQRVGEVDFLRSLPVTGVTVVEFFSASEATTRWGSDHTGGVIAITQRGSGP